MTSLSDLTLVVVATLMTSSGMTSAPLAYDQQPQCDVTVRYETRLHLYHCMHARTHARPG